MKLSEFSKSEVKEILTKQGWDDIATWEYMSMSATKELGVYKLFIFVTYNTVEGVQLSMTLFRAMGVDNTFRLYRKYVGLNDELFNLELVKAERALRTFERYYTSGCEVLVEELKEVLGG